MEGLPETVEGWLPRLGFGTSQHQARLVNAITRLIGSGRHREALLFSQRLCACQQPVSADALVLRAAALARCEAQDLALIDIRAALEIDPDHEAALRMMLRFGSDAERRASATWLDEMKALREPAGKLVDPHSIPEAAPRAQEPAPVLIIVPVHGDAAATGRCLDTLLAEGSRKVASRIVVVDDASPDPEIRLLVDRLAAEGHVTLLRNASNLGFAGSVNRALALRGEEDVLLVNADTVLPARLVDRLSAVAYRRPDTGTVTPLSNNGEYCSLPVRFRVNPMLEAAEAAAFDQRLETAFGDESVDMPNGIGFCLFIRRSMLDHVGGLSTAFGRGYGEDIEFCLRGAAAGFRNVAALGVYVAHEGGRSFGNLKRALVTRNLSRLKATYRSYRRASALFVAEDPIGVRLAEKLGVLIGKQRYNLILGPGGFAAPFMAGTAGQSASVEKGPVLLIEAHRTAGQTSLTVSAAGSGFPQGMSFALPENPQAAKTRLEENGLWPQASLRVVDPALVPDDALRLFTKLASHYDLIGLRDAGLFCPAVSGKILFLESCRFCQGRCPCSRAGTGEPDPFLRSVVHQARRLEMRHPALLPLARQRFGTVEAGFATPRVAREPNTDHPIRYLAVVAEQGGLAELAGIEAIADAMQADRQGPVLMFGPSIDARGLAARGSVLPMGRLDEAAIQRFGAFGIGAAVFVDRRLGATDPLLELLQAAGQPVARFAWRDGPATAHSDLSLPLSATETEAARLLLVWFEDIRRSQSEGSMRTSQLSSRDMERPRMFAPG